MTDIKSWIGQIERVAPPEQWEAIANTSAPTHDPRQDASRGRPRRPSIAPSAGNRKLVVIFVAFLVTAAATGFILHAFHPVRGPAPAASIPRSNGDIWVSVGGGEGGLVIYRVDPTTGASFPWWSDGRRPGISLVPVNEAAISEDYAFSPDGSQVEFSHFTDDGTELFTMWADGTHVRQLTHDHAEDGFPAWSPDGRSIAYASYRGASASPGCLGSSQCPSDLYSIPADGGTPTQLIQGLGATSPAWSPDGSQLAFVSVATDGTGTLEVMNADGSGLKAITSDTKALISFPQWSPRGSTILYLRAEPGQRFHLWTVAPDGSNPTDLLDTNADTNFGRPVWSPDGTQIAYARVVGGLPEVWLTSAQGTNDHRLAGWEHYGGAPLAWQPSSADATKEGFAIATPDLSGLSQAEAMTRIHDLGLRVAHISHNHSPNQPGTVESQYPLAGAPVPRGTRVYLRIATPLPGNDLGPLDCPRSQQRAIFPYPVTLFKQQAQTAVQAVRLNFRGLLATDVVRLTHQDEAGTYLKVQRAGLVFARMELSPVGNHGWVASEFTNCAGSAIRLPGWEVCRLTWADT
jgi:PASTA domain/WD40-like Beta Propeller Repeat